MADYYRYWTSSDYGTTSCSTNATWTTWTSSTTATSDTTWYTWTGNTTTVSSCTTSDSTWTHEELEAQRRQWAEQQAKLDAEAKEREEKRKAANEKSLQLLLDNLEENQKEIYEKTGAIPVTGQSGRKYLIRRGTCRNVEELDDKGVKFQNLCFHLKDPNIPIYDSMLTQKLMLEMAEEQARRVANYS